MSTEICPPCIHTDGAGLCDSCQADFEADPQAYLEYGPHKDGIDRWAAEQALIDRDLAEAEARPLVEADPDVPL